MKFLAILITAVGIAGLGSCEKVHAQSGVSPNLVGAPYNTPTNVINYTGSGGGYSGGSQPGYNSATNTVYFGYTQSQIAYTYAFNQALQNSGMTITGYNYSWQYLNQGYSAGNLSANVNFASTTGTSLYSKSWTLGTTTDWTTVSGTETFTNGLLASNIANFSLSFNGKDSRYWAGYYGPQVKNPSLSLNYTFDVCSTNPLSSPSCPGYAAAYLTQQCNANPLYSPSCPGYAAALLTQQCASNPLTSATCPGYAAALLTQQCTANPLYSTSCSGYQQAYHDQQCSLNQLYATDCPGYASAYLQQQCSANPLYSTTCSGYQQAYHDQQCSINPLYASDCPGYGAAYLTQQCNANSLYSPSCPGYAVAYKAQQCSANPLYATDCPGYQQAYFNQQCTANPLYSPSCPGYQTAYFNQQCSLNGLYSTQCPNYATAYATKMVLEQQNMASTVATAGTVAATAPKVTTTTTVASDGTVSTTPSATGNATVDKTITTTTTTANTAAAPAAPVQLVQPAPAPTAPTQQAQTQDKPAGDKKPDSGPTGGPQMAGPQPDGGKDQPKTARQELQEKRQEAAKKEAIAKGKNLANEMGKASDMEAQKQIQNVVIQAMGFTPGFDQYNKQMIVETQFYKPFTVYNNQQPVDNRRLGRGLFGPTDTLHNEMVDSQYNRGN
jgi:hypothetical protein